MFLVDTDVLSHFRHPRKNPGVVAWVAATRPTDMFVSTATIGEIERGIERQRSIDPAFAARLGEWLDQVLRLHQDRILPMDLAVSRRWGRLSARIGHRGIDLVIAATALEHGLTVVTRNVGDFAPTGVPTLNPFTEQA